MSTASLNKKSDETRLGEHSAVQPVSGLTSISETFAVHGLGRGGYVREEKTEKPAA